MAVFDLYKNIFKKFYEFVFAVGFFSEIIMFFMVVVLLFKSKIDLFVFIIGFNLSAFFNGFLKNLFKEPRPNHPLKFLDSEKFKSNKIVYGMPSGHSQNVFFSVVYLYLCTHHLLPWPLIGIFIGILMFVERWVFHNHTELQLIVGALVGSLFAYIVVFIKNSLQQ